MKTVVRALPAMSYSISGLKAGSWAVRRALRREVEKKSDPNAAETILPGVTGDGRRRRLA